MDQEISKKIEELSQKIEEVSKSLQQIKNYFKWTFIVTVIVIILPLIGLIFAIPKYLKMVSEITSF